MSTRNWRWEFGADHWNKLVHQYVPAFLLGRDFKEGLKISTLSERLRSGEEAGAFLARLDQDRFLGQLPCV